MRQNLSLKGLGNFFPIVPFNQEHMSNGIQQVIQILALDILYPFVEGFSQVVGNIIHLGQC